MDKVIITQQNKPINYVVKIKRDIKNNVNKNVVNIFPIYKLSLIYFEFYYIHELQRLHY